MVLKLQLHREFTGTNKVYVPSPWWRATYLVVNNGKLTLLWWHPTRKEWRRLLWNAPSLVLVFAGWWKRSEKWSSTIVRRLRSANHEMKIPVLVCWKRSTEKSSWRCANKERKRVENNQIPRREQKKLDVWILKRTMDRRLWRGLRDFVVSPSSVNEDPVAIRQDFNGEPQ